MNQFGRRSFLALFALSLAIVPPLPRPVYADAVDDRHVATALNRLDSLVADAMTTSGVPGLSVAVVYKDQVVHLKGYGVREVGTNKMVDADTVFQLASVSKPVASTVLAGLAGDGAITWDDRVIDHLPTFKMAEPIVTQQVTLRDMFSHRSGLADHAGDVLEDIGYNRAEVLSRLQYLRPEYEFRSGYAYTNFGLTAAAEAVARANNTTWEDLSQTRLYGPLGMTRTSSRFLDFWAQENKAISHVEVNGTWEARYVRDPDAQSPAGGVSSTARDLSQWLRLHLNNGAVDGKQIIAPTAMAEVHRPQVISVQPKDPSTDHPSLYGLGWNVGSDATGRVRLSHSGAFALGVGTTVMLVPSEGLGIAVVSNGAPIGIPETIALGFLDIAGMGELSRNWQPILEAAFRAQFMPNYGAEFAGRAPINPAPARPLSVYAGTYANPAMGNVKISQEGSELIMHLGPMQVPFPLRHWSGDVFTYQPIGENAGGPSGVTFAIGPGGRAEMVEIENFKAGGVPPLARIG